METLERIIAEHPFFRRSGVRTTRGCWSAAPPIYASSPGAYIFKEGEEANEFYLIRSGRVALEIFAPQRKPIVIETLAEGDILGWSWLLPPYQWKFHAHAVVDTRAIALDGKCLRTKCEQNHDLGYELLKRFAQIMERRLEATRLQLLDVYAAR